ncbi:HD domain-containing protein [Patescibacteria group bacterium]|nr:HD domain-containing protein [Patescibacteria group bacterium]
MKVGIENIAEHSCLAAQISFILAVMEGVDNPEKIACATLFHDNAESRTGDQNKLNSRYFDKSKGERRAFVDFTKRLPVPMASILINYFDDYEERNSISTSLIRDADLLQMAFQAKYYLSIGYSFAQKFIDNVEKGLKTESAKMIFEQMKETEFFEWCL